MKHDDTPTDNLADEINAAHRQVVHHIELHKHYTEIASGSTQLVRYEAARTALAEAHRVDEVKVIRDKAQAMALYAKQARDAELIQLATEIKVRAERKCGELLAEMEKRNGGHAMKARSNAATEVPRTLDQMGITKDQSSRYQRLAEMPEEHFETAIETAKETAGEVTSAHMLRLASELRKTRELKEMLRVAAANRGPVSRATEAWQDYAISLKLMHKQIKKSPLPPDCPAHMLADIRIHWATVSQFFSIHLEQ